MDEYPPRSFDLDRIVIDPRLPLLALIRSVERQIANAPIEVGFAFDGTGKVVVKTTGTVDSIRFLGAEIEAMRGRTMTHNHPSRSFFSRRDILFAAEAGLREIRAVAGRKVYCLTQPNTGWNRAAFEKECESQARKILRSRQQGLISRAEASRRGNNLIRAVVEALSLPLKVEKL